MLSCCDSNQGANLHFHLLVGHDVTNRDRGRLRDVFKEHDADLSFHAIDDAALAVLPSKGKQQGGRISWARIALAALLPEVDRIVYLDADVLVRHPISELWSTELGDAPIAAVANVVHPRMHDHVASLGIADPARYFNAGVLIIDLARWRAENTSPALVRYAVEHSTNAWWDQDALNVIFAERWLPLPPRWNAMNSLWWWSKWADGTYGSQPAQQARADPAIVHFEGPNIAKPWHYLNDHPMRDDYRAAIQRTPWRDTPLQERTAITWLIKRLPSRRWADAYTRWDTVRARFRSARR